MSDRRGSEGAPPPLERADRIDRVCDDFEAAWRAGQRPRVEDYLDAVPETDRPELLRELVAADLELRRAAGEPPETRPDRERLAGFAGDLDAAVTADGTRADAALRRTAWDDGAAPPPGLEEATRPGPVPPGGVRPPGPSIPGYELLGELGRGGMGVVYLARQVRLNRTCALKMIRDGHHAGLEASVRFLAEAEAVARLQHPNVVQIHHTGEVDGLPYVELEYMPGGSLDRRLEGTPWPPRRAATLVEALARGIAEPHRLGIIHRDLKPSNILLAADGTPKIADFGLARCLGSDSGLTGTDAILGSPSYMAPEQAGGRSRQAGPAADVYALGAILYELLTGRPPFRGATTLETLEQVRTAEPVAPSRLVPGTPRDVETICLKCLEKDPARRYPTAGVLAEDLRRFGAGEPTAARPVGPPERAWRWCRRNPTVAGLLSIVGVLVTAAAVGGAVFSVHLNEALRQSERDRGRAERDRDAARTAQREGRERLLDARVSEARASRFSRRVGQRFGTLGALREAAALARELNKPPETFSTLRNLAIAALALPDIHADAAWVSDPDEPGWIEQDRDFDPGFRRLAVYSDGGEVSIRRIGANPQETAEFARLPGSGGGGRVEWAPGGRFLGVVHSLYTQAGGRLQVWRLTGDRPTVAVEEPAGCKAFGFAPDSRRLVTVGDELLRVYDLEAGKLEQSMPAPAGELWVWVAHHPHRPEVALTTTTGVVLVSLTNGREVGRLPIAGRPGRVAWHPHGELLAVTFLDRVEVWDATRPHRNWTLDHSGGGVVASFNGAGDLLSTGGWAGRLRLWDPYTGRKALEVAYGGARFGPGDRLGATFADGEVGNARRLTRVEAGREYRTLVAGTSIGGSKDYHSVAVHPGGRLVAVSTGQGLGLIDLMTGGEREFVPGYTSAIQFEPSGALLANTPAGLVRWPVRSEPGEPQALSVGPPEPVPVGRPGAINALARSADGAVLAASNFDGAWAWPRDRPRAAVPLRPHDDCRYVDISPDGQWVATGSHNGRGLKVWDTAGGQLVRTLLPDSNWTMPSFSPDGHWLRNKDGESWRVGDWSAGPGHSGRGPVAFTSDGRLAAEGWQKGYVPLIDPDTGRELARLEDPNQDALGALTFSPDGTRLLGTTADGLCIRVWDLRLIRRGLAELGLDWDAPPYPPGAAEAPDPAPLAVRTLGADLLSDPRKMRRAEWERQLWRLVLAPLRPEAHLDWGAHALPDAPALAAFHLTVAVTLRPDLTEARRLRAEAYFALGLWPRVVADADAVLARQPAQARALDLRARANQRLGRHADAVADLTAMIARYPQDAGLYDRRAASYAALGEAARAAADREQSFRMLSAAPSTLNNQAWQLVTGPPDARDSKWALKLITEAMKRQPDDPTFLNTLGVVQYRDGLLREAVATLEKSLAAGNGENDAFDLYFLSMCHARLGDPAKARDCLARAVRWTEARTGLDAEHVAELKEFRAEAEAIVGKE